MSNLTVITPPAEEALSLGAAKEYLRIGHDGEDGLVAALIPAARARLEIVGGFALVTQTLKRGWDCWPPGVTRHGVRLLPGPASALVAVEIIGLEGGTETVTTRFVLEDGRLKLKPFVPLPGIPLGGRVEVTFVAGYGAAADVPADLVQALKRLVLVAYQRGEGADLPEDVAAILNTRTEVRL
ncbi:head-tail connector protein [Hyphomonas jannaschiana]|uniref:PhiE125 gp8 family phage protein n=1 Tax=Hyphomonas jannaschiana VP2 TaxID=1280952 RepID=A0A059FGF9_9PROT|nr:hypothetical protein [Hyphomonas jannaschiana]KCZ89568.1 hypothetical protein HJA_04932 [Hyphomonas jannaschiana VP2]